MAKDISFSNLSHKSLYSSTPVLTSTPLSSSKSFSTPPFSPRLARRFPTQPGLSPLLRSSSIHLPSPLKTSPPLSEILSSSSVSSVPLRVSQAFYNNFYALRLNMQIKDQPVELNLSGEHPKLACEYLTCSVTFQPIFNKFQYLLKDFGISSLLRCFSDPLPLIELAVESPKDIRNLLLNRDTIASYLWVIVCNEFINASKDIGIGLLKGEEDRDPNAVRFQLTYRPGNTCSLDLYLISPNSQQREVDIYQVTLANFDYASKMMMSSLIFDFSSAMSSYHNCLPFKNTLQEKVLLADLKEELGEVTNWFHMGLHLDFKSSSLMNTLFNFRNLSACRSQFLALWYNQQASALGDNTQTWEHIVAVLIAVCRKSVADIIVRKYGLDVNRYYEMLKKSEKADLATQSGLLSTPEVATLIAEMKDKDKQMMEKAKPLRAYELQRKVLELSVNEVFKSLHDNIENIREKSEQRNQMKQRVIKTAEEIEALEDVLKLFDSEKTKDCERDEHGTVKLGVSKQKTVLASQQKLLCDVLEEKRSLHQSLQKSTVTLIQEIKGITKEIQEQRNSLTKEHQLLLSKCQQIHQLRGVTGLLQAKINACGMKLDQILQQRVAANSVFKSSVFQLHIDILTQEAKEKDSQLTLYSAREKRAQKMASETQDKLEDMDLNEQTGEMIMQGAEGEEDEDKRLMEWLKPVMESVELRNKLLKAKLSHWNNERSKRITSAEGKALTQMLNSLKEISFDAQDRTEVEVEEVDSEQTPSVECMLKPNQNYQAVKVNTLIKFTIELDQGVKLNLKRFIYRVDIKSIANNSITSVDFEPDTSTTPHTLTFSFRPSVRGRHQVFVTCNNKPLRGAGMYLFKAKQSPSLLGYPVRVIDGLNYPYNICSVPNSQILLVSESKGCKVLFIDKGSGNKILAMNAKGLMKIPNGIAVKEDGVICVVDSGSHSICLFTQQGVPIGKFGTMGDAYNEFFFPYGIKISPFDKSICICDHSNDRIQIFSNDMKFQRIVHAVSPYDIDYDSKKCMYVTDRRNHLIAVFNEKDQCIHSISGKGTEEGRLLEPRGIAIDEQDFIYVVEEGNCRVSVFDNLGQFVTSFGTEGAQNGEFTAPQGICIDEDGYVYVCDMLNNRIQVF